MLKLFLLFGFICLSLQYRLKSFHPHRMKAAEHRMGHNENHSHHKNWVQYMLGEMFFKDNDDDRDDDNDDLEEYTEDTEHLPYQVILKNENYEQRYYPAAQFVCNTTKNIDTARDPFDGLDKMSPWTLMASKRWRNHHTSHMFKELFKYISGVNKNQESVEMTSPVTTCHNVTKEDPLGNFEDQTMCFYLPSKYQENHKHSDEDDAVETKVRTRRHDSSAAPEPMDNGLVYLQSRPAMYVFVRRFGGFPISHDAWEKQKDALEADLLHDKHKFHQGEYFTVGYDSPWKLTKRRNEVWLKCLDADHQFPAPGVEKEYFKDSIFGSGTSGSR